MQRYPFEPYVALEGELLLVLGEVLLITSGGPGG